MTGKQIKEAWAKLPSSWGEMTPDQRKTREELFCREMINSCLAYGQAQSSFYNPETKEFGLYAEDYIKELGKTTVVRLFNEQCDSFSRAQVNRNVYTDSEGCTYSSIIWEDDFTENLN
jgi:hypothetical protein